MSCPVDGTSGSWGCFFKVLPNDLYKAKSLFAGLIITTVFINTQLRRSQRSTVFQCSELWFGFRQSQWLTSTKLTTGQLLHGFTRSTSRGQIQASIDCLIVLPLFNAEFGAFRTTAFFLFTNLLHANIICLVAYLRNPSAHLNEEVRDRTLASVTGAAQHGMQPYAITSEELCEQRRWHERQIRAMDRMNTLRAWRQNPDEDD